MNTGNKSLVNYTAIKILKRLSIMAQFKKHSADPNRGGLLFGKKNDPQYSNGFFKVLLYCLQKWSNTYGNSTYKNFSLYKKFYEDLREKHHVVFLSDHEEQLFQKKDQ
jgi:hypothetical protein